MHFAPHGSIPYQQHIHRPLPALPRVLADSGYRTVAVHPYARWFWRRDEVFPLFGFQKFLSLENYDAIPHIGHYASDTWLTQEIIRLLDVPDDRPLFLFAITMQNHGPYDFPRDGSPSGEIHIESDLPPDSQQFLRVYARGVSDGDRMLATLAKYVQDRKRPTLLVFFGDHLPYLGPAYQVYRQSGFLGQNQSLTKQQKHCLLHRVPVAYLANFPYEAPAQDISINFLAPLLLQAMNVELPPQMRLARKAMDRFPILAASWCMGADGTINSYDAGLDEILEDYQMLQYDLIFGDQYSWQPS
jgi:hypothetical protein